jgi:hypothetical protein
MTTGHWSPVTPAAWKSSQIAAESGQICMIYKQILLDGACRPWLTCRDIQSDG